MNFDFSWIEWLDFNFGMEDELLFSGMSILLYPYILKPLLHVNFSSYIVSICGDTCKALFVLILSTLISR